MKTVHLLRVEEGPDRFVSLIEAARAEGLRVGWMDLGAVTSPVPEALETAAGFGVLRAVAVGEGRVLSLKPLRGVPVLRDLLREHFQGCALVLVRGPVNAPLLSPDEDGWRVVPPESASRRYTSGELASALRKPHPWKSAAEHGT